MKFQKLEQESGITGQQLLEWHRHTAPRKEAIEKEVSELAIQKDGLRTELLELNELKKMKNDLAAKGITLHKLEAFLDTHVTLEKLGFTKEAASILAKELDKIGMSPETAAKRIVTYLAEAQSLENVKSKLTSEIDQLQKIQAILNEDIVEKKKEINDIENRIQTRITNEETLIQQAANEFYNKTIEEKEQIQAELKELSKQLEELHKEVIKEQKELKDLEAKKEDLKDRYILGDGLIQILRDPASTSQQQLRRLSASAKKAIESREKEFFATASGATNEANKLIVTILTEYARKDLVPLYKYNSLETREKKFKQLADYWKKEYEENNKLIAKMVEDKKETEKAIGVSVIRLMKTEYQHAPIPVLKNIRDWLDQIIKEKSGQTPYSRVELSNQTIGWFEKKIKKPPESKGRLVLRPYDESKKK